MTNKMLQDAKLLYNIFESDCETGYLPCSSGRCLPLSIFCDGFNDCGDFSDEGEANCGNSIYVA